MKERLTTESVLPADCASATLVGRMQVPALEGPVLVRVTQLGSHQVYLASTRLIDSGVADRVAENAFSNDPNEGARDVGIRAAGCRV